MPKTIRTNIGHGRYVLGSSCNLIVKNSLSLSVCLSVRCPACLPACLSVRLSVCLSVSEFPNLHQSHTTPNNRRQCPLEIKPTIRLVLFNDATVSHLSAMTVQHGTMDLYDAKRAALGESELWLCLLHNFYRQMLLCTCNRMLPSTLLTAMLSPQHS